MMEQTITVMSSLILKKNSLKQCFVVCNDGKKKFKGENVLVSIKLPSNKTREQN